MWVEDTRPRHPSGARRFILALVPSVDVRLAYLVLDVLLIVAVLVAVFLFGVFWFPLLLLAVVVGLSLWLVRRYYLDYLDDPAEHRTRG